MTHRKPYYFAHPYSAPPDAGPGESRNICWHNFEACNARAGRLIRLGYVILSPISHSHPIDMETYRAGEPVPPEEWYAQDFAIIAATDWAGLILAPGWAFSKGCQWECARFEERELPIHKYADVIAAGPVTDGKVPTLG